MTANEFAAICAEAHMPPELVLEDPHIVEALLANMDDEVRRIIEEEF